MQHNLRAQAFEEATEDVSAGALPKEMKKERCVAGYPLCGVARRNTPWRSSRLWCPGLPSAALAVEKRALEPPKDTAERVHRELQESLDVDATAKCPHCLLVVPPSYLSRHVKLCAEAKPAAGSDSDEDGSGGRDGVAVVPCPSCGMKVQRARMARHVSSGTCARAQASGATRFSWHLCVCVVCVSVSVCLCACVCVCLVVAPAIAPPPKPYLFMRSHRQTRFKERRRSQSSARGPGCRCQGGHRGGEAASSKRKDSGRRIPREYSGPCKGKHPSTAPLQHDLSYSGHPEAACVCWRQ